MKALNVLLAIGVSVAIALSVFEGGLRLIPQFRPRATLNRFDPVTGWSQTPGRRVTRSVAGNDIEFAINEFGLRDDPGVGPTKSAGKLRVLALGDSFVLGFTVAREQCFVDLLEQRWNLEGRNIEVVNAGTEGWSTDQQVAWFEDRGQSFQPDVVLLFPYENDIYWCGEERYSRWPKPRYEPDGSRVSRLLVDPGASGLLSKTAFGSFLGVTLRALLHPPKLGEFIAPGTDIRLAGEWAPLLKQPPSFLADCEARLEGALIALKRACSEVGAQLVVIPIPSKSAIHAEEREFLRTWDDGLGGLPDDAWSPDRPVERFLEIARKHQIESLDPRQALRAQAPAHQLYFEKQIEWHLNVAGNAALANFVHDEFERMDVFGDAHAAKSVSPPALLADQEPVGPRRWPYVFAALWVALSALYLGTYANDRNWKAPLKVGAMLAAVFAIVLGGGKLVALVPAQYSGWILACFVLVVLGFVGWKLGRRIATILELLRSFTLRGHWYLMPLLVVLLSIGSLLVVAASSPLIAPFIYTLF